MIPINPVLDGLDKQNAKMLQKAFSEIKPLIREAQKLLDKIPLRDIVVDEYTGEKVKCRFATGNELQQILMRVFKGRVIIQTYPLETDRTPTVVSHIGILTEQGYVMLQGSIASEKYDNDFLGRSLLSAESRAIRRALRKIGLRAEFDLENLKEITQQNKNISDNKSSESVDVVIDDEALVPDISVDCKKNNEINTNTSDEESDCQSDATKKSDTIKTKRRTNKKKTTRKTTKTTTKSQKEDEVSLDALINFKAPLSILPTYANSLFKWCSDCYKYLKSKNKIKNVSEFISNVLSDYYYEQSNSKDEFEPLMFCSTSDLEQIYKHYLEQLKS
jgi:TusA-related sulfurtransferase